MIPTLYLIEINTREHFSVYSWKPKHFSVKNCWFSGEANILTYEFSELMAQKCALSMKGIKDEIYLIYGLRHNKETSTLKKSINAFLQYAKNENKNITRALFEMNFFEKL